MTADIPKETIVPRDHLDAAEQSGEKTTLHQNQANVANMAGDGGIEGGDPIRVKRKESQKEGHERDQQQSQPDEMPVASTCIDELDVQYGEGYCSKRNLNCQQHVEFRSSLCCATCAST